MITKMTDPDILCWRIQISIERSLHILLGHSNSNRKKIVHYRNDFKDDRNLHRLGDTQFPTEKKQFSIEMISKMTDPNILCVDIQNPAEKDNSISKGLKDRKIAKLYILCRDIQIPTEKDSSLSK